MVKEVLSCEGNVKISSCSGEKIILHLRLLSHGAGLPKNIWCGGEAGNSIYPGYGLEDECDGKTGTCRVSVRAKADKIRRRCWLLKRRPKEGKFFL